MALAGLDGAPKQDAREGPGVSWSQVVRLRSGVGDLLQAGDDVVSHLDHSVGGLGGLVHVRAAGLGAVGLEGLAGHLLAGRVEPCAFLLGGGVEGIVGGLHVIRVVLHRIVVSGGLGGPVVATLLQVAVLGGVGLDVGVDLGGFGLAGVDLVGSEFLVGVTATGAVVVLALAQIVLFLLPGGDVRVELDLG